jgi:photosystem II stability/assembly factor-like uncharacterized protein
VGLNLWAAARDGLFHSDDAGATWQPVTAGLPSAAVFALAADATGRLYLGLDGAGIYTQTDDRAGWRRLIAEDPLAAAAILSLAVSADGQQLYAGAAGQGVLSSRDGGQTWRSAYPGEYGRNVALHPARPERAVVALRDQLARTLDGGESWQRLAAPWASRQVVSLLWLADGTLGAGTAEGELYYSRDNGDSWLGGSLDLPPGGIMDLAVIEPEAIDRPHQLLAGTWTGIYGSADGGQSWRELAPDLGNPNAETLRATGAGLLLGTRTGLYRWQPESQDWLPHSADLPSGVASLAVDPLDPQLLYAGTVSHGVYRSDNGGQSWQPLPTLRKGIPDIAIDPQEPDNIYILAAWERVYDSRDGGQSWGAHWAGLGEVIETISLAVDPVEPVVYVGTEMGLYRRYNDDDWELVAPDLADQSILALLAQSRSKFLGRESILYLGTTRGIYYSRDLGNTIQGGGSGWGSGLENISVTALLPDPQDDQKLYAGTAFAGVYASVDGGQNWQPIGSTELAAGIVEALAWGPDGDLFVATTGGVWRGRD